MPLTENIEKEEIIKEASYAGNIGFQEMINFYQVASPSDIKKMEMLVKKASWSGVKKLFQKVLGVTLQ
jgi:hypothetical protein